MQAAIIIGLLGQFQLWSKNCGDLIPKAITKKNEISYNMTFPKEVGEKYIIGQSQRLGDYKVRFLTVAKAPNPPQASYWSFQVEISDIIVNKPVAQCSFYQSYQNSKLPVGSCSGANVKNSQCGLIGISLYSID